MKLLPTGALCTLFTAGALAFSGCSSGPGYVSGGAAVVVPSRPYYQVRDRYYHCHRGVCHSIRHSNYYWSGSSYRPRPHGYRPRPHHSVRPMPRPRPRPR